MSEKAKILRVEKIAPSLFSLVFISEKIASFALPGQFVHIKCSADNSYDPLLRRPISICDIDPSGDMVTVVFQQKGRGTENLSRMKKGDVIDVMGPLGTSYNMKDRQRAAFIGGGLGIFPLVLAARMLKSPVKDVFMGYRTKELVVLEKEFKAFSRDRLFMSTDDGTYGRKGLVTEPFLEELEKASYEVVFTCGPLPMIKKVAAICEEHNIPCQVSMEERMACGIGACLSCACKVQSKEEEENYTRVCVEGPVFWSKKIVL